MALADRLTLSEAIEQVSLMIEQGWPNGRKGLSDGYLGGLASILADYPRMVALKACAVRTGVARETKFLPTVADLVAFCERETAAMRGPVEREDADARIMREMAVRREAEARSLLERATRPALEELRAKHGPTWGLQAMEDEKSRERSRRAVQDANDRAYARIGGEMSGGLLITEALLASIRARAAAQNETGGP